ncbi:hypothetical protein ACH5A7_35235 [Streptomyces sp. NPDC018955]|uniref:hypothetical protein n=1 Tax=Streptomyces sp. NPDC018955 TaxID=3365055 RepID=UPI00378D1BA0
MAGGAGVAALDAGDPVRMSASGRAAWLVRQAATSSRCGWRSGPPGNGIPGREL